MTIEPSSSVVETDSQGEVTISSVASVHADRQSTNTIAHLDIESLRLQL